MDSVSRVVSIPLAKTAPAAWRWTLLASSVLLVGLGVAVTYLLWMGVVIWGVNIPVAWGFAITNFVWWIGIGHAGTFISAILLLANQHWRVSISRLSEAMTIFAILCAALFPCLHLGRQWFVYWILPYPNSMGIYSQFRGPFVWDAFAVGTYGTVSAFYLYIGMIPDLAMIRDRAESHRKRFIYGILAMGWKGRSRDWRLFNGITLLLAGLATPLVISVHSVVSLDFASAIVPGWAFTVFPPYFVAGAIFSGLAMVLVLAILIRKVFNLESLLQIEQLDKVALLLLAMSWMVAYGYYLEAWTAWYSDDPHERNAFFNTAFGHYGSLYWIMLALNVAVPQVLWSPRLRRSLPVLFSVGVLVVIGMWIERFMIIVTSLERGYMSSAWGEYFPTIWDWLLLFGVIGLFIFLYCLFVRFLPVAPLHEIRALADAKEME